MDALNGVLLSGLLVLAMGLIITMFVVLLRVSKTIAFLQKELAELNLSIVPLLKRLDTLAEKAEDTLVEFSEHKESLADSVEYIRKITRNVYRLEHIVQEQIEPSLLSFASVLSGIRKGIQGFADSWRKTT